MEFGLNHTLFLTTLCNLFTWQTSPKWPWSRSFYKRFLPNYTHKKNMFAQVKVPFRSGKGSSIQRNSSPSFPTGALQLQEWIHKGHELCSVEALDLAERKKIKQTAAWHNQSILNKQKSLQHCPCFFITFTWKKWLLKPSGPFGNHGIPWFRVRRPSRRPGFKPWSNATVTLESCIAGDRTNK